VGGEFGEDEVIGVAEQSLQFCGAENAPMLERDPIGAGKIGCGDDTVHFKQFRINFRRSGKAEDGFLPIMMVKII